MERDAEATRARLLAAARKEFAAFGIAGARVDRIAAAAGSNKAQIYNYFHSKEGLFEAVFDGIVQQVVEGVPLDVDDLPGYAERLAAGNAESPEIMRLATWQRLERADKPLLELSLASNKAKIEAIAAAQAEGRISARYSPAVTLALVLHMSAFWETIQPELASTVSIDEDERIRLVRDAVSALLEP